ncbi:MAG: SprT-like domain-containing protein [Armatimonadetes bacterium]|nr:SprT-like domain-containing protein [Armatimonadota bacterium]
MSADLLARWREAEAWVPPPELLTDAGRAARRAGGRKWAGFAPLPTCPPPRAEWAPLLLAAYADYDQLNALHFDGLCPPVRLTINPRLRSAAGRIFPSRRLIELNFHRLTQVPDSRAETVFHEMIHLWLHTRGLPSGHTTEFVAKMAERGHEAVRFGRGPGVNGQRHDYPGSSRRVAYRCPGCDLEFEVRRRYGRPMACARCLRDDRGTQILVEVGVRYLPG